MSASSARVGAAIGELDVLLDVETPEQITFSYSVAGIGSRGAAAIIDALICIGTLIALLLLIVTATRELGVGLRGFSMTSATWLFAAYLIAQFVVLWGYNVLFEGLWDGQTPGKRIMRLRVVRDGGYSVTFEASAVRNLLRAVDAQPIPLYLVAIVSALVTRSRKRVGDLVAGTFVIREERVRTIPTGTTKATETEGVARQVTTQLTDDEYGVLERYMARRLELAPERRTALAAALAQRFASRLPGDDTTALSARLLRLYENDRDARAIGVAARSDTGARREQHAIVALGLKRWNDFDASLAAMGRRGLGSVSARDVSSLVSRYREITTDLARLQTATRGRTSDAMFFLSRLVARGHNVLYRQRAKTLGSFGRYIARTVPGEILRSWRQIGIAAALTFGPAAISYAAVMHEPAVAERLLPDEMISRAETGAAREKRGEGYVSIPAEVRPIMASAIISNNVKVTYLAFALGVTAGIGTVLLLLFNGVSIGAGVGVFATHGIAHLILAFIAPHGVLELSAICIAGGGGLLIAQGMLLPGAVTRREAIVHYGRRAINLIAGSTLLLIVAGTLEGNVSPRVWPMSWKVSVSLVTAVALVGYLWLGRNYEAGKHGSGEAAKGPPTTPSRS